MRKNLLITVILMLIALTVEAIPVKKGTTRIVTLPNGSEVTVLLCGDEYGHWWEAADGQRVSIDEHDKVSFLASSDMTKLKDAALTKRNERNVLRSKRIAKAHKASETSNFIGQKKGLVILVNFSDRGMKPTSTQSEFDDMFNKVGYSNNNHIGSLHDYFMDQSYGQFDLEFDVVGPVTVSKTMAYYGKNDANGDDSHPGEMVIEACRLADEEYGLDFADYDWDGDGEVDQVFLIYAGYGENAGAAASTIWPHEYELSAAGSYGDGEGAITIDDVLIDTYAVSSELAGTNGYTMNGIGTACHEFSHCLGYPDFYDIDYSGGWGMSSWDVMDQGSYNGPYGNGEVPSGYTSYERWVAGWLEPKELTLGMTVDALKPLGDEPDAYVVYNEGNHDEYYLLENRTSEGWFKYMDYYTGVSGLLILHVDYNASVWNSNKPNDSKSHQRMTIIPASGQFPSRSTAATYQKQLYPYGTKNSLTNETSPKASLFNKNTDGSKLMNKPIYDITQNEDYTISFRCGDTDIPGPGVDPGDNPDPGINPGENPEGIIFYESFNSCNGTGGNDDLWNGSIASAVFTPDNLDWIYSKAYGADRCAKIGTGSVAGVATTPSFSLDGDATLSFKAACWDSDRDDVNMTVLLGDEEIANVELLRGAWTPYSLDITGNGACTLTFKTTNRFFLDDVLVAVSDLSNNIVSVPSSVTDNIIYDLSGRRLHVLPEKGVYIINGRKYIK